MEQTLSNFKVETRPRGSSWGHAGHGPLPPHTLRKRRFRLWAAALLQCIICTIPQSSNMAGKSPINGDFNWTIMIIVMCGKCTPYWLVVVAGSYCWGGHLCGASLEISHDHWADLKGCILKENRVFDTIQLWWLWSLAKLPVNKNQESLSRTDFSTRWTP